MKIIKGIVSEPQKVVIYGPQGIGKSSLAALFPSPLFLDTEKGSRRLAVDRVAIDSLKEFADCITAIAKQSDFREYQTIVVDTVDWLEAKVKEKIVSQYSAKDRAYDREGSYIGDEMMKVLSSLDSLIVAGKHVVLTAHSATVKIDLPDQQASFDRYELDMNKKHVAPIVKHWCDHLLFMRYKLRVREVDDGKNKALGGEERLLCLSTVASYDAKCRSRDAALSGEHSMKTPEDGIAVVKRIFASVSAPWGDAVEAKPVEVKPEEKPEAKPETKIETTVTPEEDTIPMDHGPHPLTEVVGEHEAAVNAYLVSRGVIQAGQSFRDVPATYIDRVQKNPAGFMSQAVKGVAS